jgi:hypothetical protein
VGLEAGVDGLGVQAPAEPLGGGAGQLRLAGARLTLHQQGRPAA